MRTFSNAGISPKVYDSTLRNPQQKDRSILLLFIAYLYEEIAVPTLSRSFFESNIKNKVS
jgi:hypothetical protein